jgi:6,7-dimethyl-8-ribityllumazine synthase
MSEEVQALQIRDAAGLRIAVARSRFNDTITAGLAAGAVDYLTSSGAQFDVYDAPGAFELPLLAAQLLRAGYDAVVALGAVVEGDTDHYEHVATQASAGLMRVMLDSSKPVAFGILTVRQEEQAVARSRPGPGNKGAEAAAAAVETAIMIRDIGS